jgi:DNA-binding transcriptional LysR family regulator
MDWPASPRTSRWRGPALGKARNVLDDYVAPPLIGRALYLHNRYLSAKVRAFVDFLVERFAGEPA